MVPIIFYSFQEKKNETYPAWEESQNVEKIWWMSVDISWKRNTEQKNAGRRHDTVFIVTRESEGCHLLKDKPLFFLNLLFDSV